MSDMKKLLEAIDSMSKAETKPTGPKFPGYWKGTDPASKAKSKMVGSAEDKHSMLKDLSKTAKSKSFERRLSEEFENFKTPTQPNPSDNVKLDIPLLIRLLEYAREDAKDDMDLHRIATNLVELSKSGKTLSMQDYENAISDKLDEYGNAQNPNTQTTTPGTDGSLQADAENSAQAKTTDAAVQKNVAALKTIEPELNPTQAKTALQKTDVPGAQMTAAELNQAKKLTSIIEPALSDPNLGPQVTALLNKAGKIEQAQAAQQKAQGMK